MNRFWSNAIKSLKPYTPGEQPAQQGLIKLNTNENPYGPSPLVLAAIKNAVDASLRLYPDPGATEFKKTIANNKGLQSNQVFVGNSSDEVLAHAFMAFFRQDRPILFPEITYNFYPVWCALYQIDYTTVALRDDFTIDVKQYAKANGGVIIANPNAPTGLTLDRADVQQLLIDNADSTVIIDEAYVDFGAQSALALIAEHPNLLVVQTLSKSRSLAGLRVGFALGDEELIAGLERVKNSFHPYALSRLALAGATAALQDEAYFTETIEKIMATRSQTTAKLQKLGFEVIPSKANFLFVKHKTWRSTTLQAALRKKGILVRHFDQPKVDAYLRISIGTDDAMQTLLHALQNLISQEA